MILHVIPSLFFSKPGDFVFARVLPCIEPILQWIVLFCEPRLGWSADRGYYCPVPGQQWDKSIDDIQ